MERVINGVVYDVVIVNDQIFSIDRSSAVLAPTTLAAGATYNSPILSTVAMPHIAVAAVLSQIGILVLQPYLDLAGTIPASLPYQTNLSASTPSIIDIGPKYVFQSFKVSITNQSGSLGNLTSVLAILRSDTAGGNFLSGMLPALGNATAATNFRASLVSGIPGSGSVSIPTNIRASIKSTVSGSGLAFAVSS